MEDHIANGVNTTYPESAMTNDKDGKIEDAECQGRGVGSVIGMMGSVWMVLDIDAVSCRL